VLIICPVGVLKFCTTHLGRQFMSCPRFTQEGVSVGCYEPTVTKIFCALQNFMYTSTNARFPAVPKGGGGGSRVEISGVRQGAQGPSVLYMGMFFLGSIIICRLYKLILSNQTQITPQPRVRLHNLV